MTISEKKSFKANIIDQEGFYRKVRLRVKDETIYEDRGGFYRIFVTILLCITIIGIFFLEWSNKDPERYHKLFAMNEVRAIKRVNLVMSPNGKKEVRAIALAIGYDQMFYIHTKEDSDLVRFINEHYYDELSHEDYQRVGKKYENHIQMFRDTNKYAPLVLVLIILIIAVAILTPVIVNSLVQQFSVIKSSYQ